VHPFCHRVFLTYTTEWTSSPVVDAPQWGTYRLVRGR